MSQRLIWRISVKNGSSSFRNAGANVPEPVQMGELFIETDYNNNPRIAIEAAAKHLKLGDSVQHFENGSFLGEIGYRKGGYVASAALANEGGRFDNVVWLDATTHTERRNDSTGAIVLDGDPRLAANSQEAKS